MSGFIQKLRTLTLGSAHDLLDKAIDMNSPTILRQYVRDLEDAIDKMRNEGAIQAGSVRTLTREKGDLEHRIETGKADIQKILAGTAANKTELARMRGAEVIRMTSQLENTTKDLQSQQTASAAIDAAVMKLDSKHTDMVSRLRELERLDRDSKIKESAARSVSAAGKLASGGADISVDDIESKMRARNDVASEKFDRAMGDLNTGEEDQETQSQVDELLRNLQPQPEQKIA